MASTPGLALELVSRALPNIPLDNGVTNVRTGILLLDALPLLTMLPCAATLVLYWRTRRYTDLAVFGLGFLLACIYHVAHMHPLGLGQALVLGVPGPVWRTLDILCAQTLLARTLGHALGVRTSLLAVLTNLTFPTTLMAYTHTVGKLTLGVASKVLLLIMLAALAGKVTVEGWETLPTYCPRRGKRALAAFMLAFLAFPMPELAPRLYWLFHSLWHVLLAQGYWDLYVMLEGEVVNSQSRLQSRRVRATDHRGKLRLNPAWLRRRVVQAGAAAVTGQQAVQDEQEEWRRATQRERLRWHALLTCGESGTESGGESSSCCSSSCEKLG